MHHQKVGWIAFLLSRTSRWRKPTFFYHSCLFSAKIRYWDLFHQINKCVIDNLEIFYLNRFPTRFARKRMNWSSCCLPGGWGEEGGAGDRVPRCRPGDLPPRVWNLLQVSVIDPSSAPSSRLHNFIWIRTICLKGGDHEK